MDNTPAFKNPLNNHIVARTHPQNVTVNALGLLALPLPCWNLLLPLGTEIINESHRQKFSGPSDGAKNCYRSSSSFDGTYN